LTVAWYHRPQVWLALGVFLVALGVYQATTSPNIAFWDCGEFITTSHILGIPHQPGTPLYVLAGRVFDILLGSPEVNSPALKTALAVNFMSVLFSALAVMFVYVIIVNLARRADADAGWLAHAGGLIGAFFLLFSETYWNNAIEAEVYGLASFVITLVTWLAIRWYDARKSQHSDRLLYLMIYLLGLGVGFHLGSLLVYPGVFLLILVARERQLPVVDLVAMSCGLGLFLLSTMIRDDSLLLLLLVVYLAFAAARIFAGRPFVLVGSSLFLLGLTVHLFMLVRAPLDPAINQSQPDNFATLMSVLRREQYPPINVFKRQADILWQAQHYYGYFIKQFYFLGDGSSFLSRVATFLGPIFLGLLGVFHGIRRLRPLIWLLVASYLINADGLWIYLNFTNHEVRERDYFFFAAFLFFAILIGLGAAALLRYAAGPEGKSASELAPDEKVSPVRTGMLAKTGAALLLVISLLPLLQPGHRKWFEHDRSHNTIAREYAWNLLAGLDAGAILFTNGDNDTFPIWYLQEVEHFRRDVTVVNLSLVNLPWYVKQMRRRHPPMPLSYTDKQIDQLQARLVEDPQTGERFIIYVRDYVVHDIVTTNARAPDARPVFFAVTIPQENMARYFGNLQMEGLAYRLSPERSADGQPVVNARRLMHNTFGIYDFNAILSGDSDQRRALYSELTGWQSDTPADLYTDPIGDRSLDLEPLFPELGEERTDVFRDENTSNLLGNYPSAMVRAGYRLLGDAQAHTAVTDTADYDRLLDESLACFELAKRMDPLFQPVIDLYPIILVDRGRSPEALAFLSSLQGKVTPQVEERSMYETAFAMAQVGEANLAAQWIDQRIAEEPDRKFLYDLLFKIYQNLRSLSDCQAVMERWRTRSGETDPAMAEAVARLQAQDLEREQQRIENALEEAH
jgi:hypothetical protein